MSQIIITHLRTAEGSPNVMTYEKLWAIHSKNEKKTSQS